MTFSELREQLFSTVAADGGRAISLKTGVRAPVTKGALDAMISSTRQTVLHILEERLGISEAEAVARLKTENIRPYLPLLEAAAKRRAQGHARAGNASGHVRRVLRILHPAEFGRPRSKGGTVAVQPAWDAILAACAEVWSDPQTIRQYRSDIARLARLTFAAGFANPAELPERAVVEELLREAGLSANSISGSITGYRKAVAWLRQQGREVLANDLPQRVSARERGLRSLPSHAFEGLPEGASPATMRADSLLPHIAPAIAEAHQEWVTEGGGASLRPATRNDVLRTLSLVVAHLYRHPELLANSRHPSGTPASPLAELDLAELWELDYASTVEAVAVASSRAAARALKAIGGQAVATPLVWKLVEDLAGEITMLVKGQPYSKAAVKILESLWSLTRGLYEESFRAVAPARWVAMRTRYNIQWTKMDSANAEAKVTGMKNKALLIRTITLPLVVCVCLPRMAARVRRYQRVWEAARDRAITAGHDDPLAHHGARRAYVRYEDVLEEYVAFAVFTADPLRNKNIHYGWLGDEGEFRPTVRYDAQGLPVAIEGMASFFTAHGGRNAEAAFKQPDAQDRLWRWAPAMIELDLVLAYLMGPRRDRIIERGLLTDATGAPVTRDTYSLQEDLRQGTLALFISPGDTNTHPHGAYGSDKISDLYGRALHYCVTRILKVKGVPAYDDCGAGSEWRGLLSGHSVRLLWSTYWLGIREEHGPRHRDGRVISGIRIAMDATSDEEKTLRDEYTDVAAAVRDRMRDPAGEWSHPRTYDSWMDRVYLLERIDWTREELPLPPTVLQDDAKEEAPRQVRIRRRRAAVVGT